MGEYLYGGKASWAGANVPLSIKALKFCSYFQTCLRLKPTLSNESGKGHIRKLC